MFDVDYEVTPMTLADAVAFIEACRQHYNKANPNDVQSFADIVEIMFTQPDGNDDIDYACLQTLTNVYQRQNLRKTAYLKQLEKLVDPARVKSMLADPEMFSPQ